MPRLSKPASPFRFYNSSPEVIRLMVMTALGNADRQEIGHRAKNRAENCQSETSSN